MSDICKYCLESNLEMLKPCKCKTAVCNPCLTKWMITLYHELKLPICEICNDNYSPEIVSKIVAQNKNQFQHVNDNVTIGDIVDAVLEYIGAEPDNNYHVVVMRRPT